MNRLLGMLAILLYSFSIQAQDTLSLARAISLGLRNNFDVQIEKRNVEIAKNNNEWGQTGKLPTIAFNSNQNNSIIQRKAANPFAVPGLNITDNVTGQLDVRFLLFSGFVIKMNKRQLEELERFSYGNAAFVMETTIEAIILAYYQALLEKERLHILQTNIAYSRERFDYVKLRKELGGAIAFDVLQEQTTYLTDSANVLLQGIVYKNSLRQLNYLLNENLDRLFQLSDSLEYKHEVYDYEDLKTRTLRSNTNLRNQYINQEIIRYNTKIAESVKYPSVTLNMGATGSLDQLNAGFRVNTGNSVENLVGNVNRDANLPVYRTTNETDLRQLTQYGNSYGGYANLSLRFTLFNGGQIKREIENSRVREKIVELGIDQLRLSLENDLLANYDLYNLRNQLVDIALTKLEVADLNLDLANERYRNGALSAIDLRIVQENALNAALETYQAIFNSIATKVGLIRITGSLIENPLAD